MGFWLSRYSLSCLLMSCRLTHRSSLSVSIGSSCTVGIGGSLRLQTTLYFRKEGLLLALYVTSPRKCKSHMRKMGAFVVKPIGSQFLRFTNCCPKLQKFQRFFWRSKYLFSLYSKILWAFCFSCTISKLNQSTFSYVISKEFCRFSALFPH